MKTLTKPQTKGFKALIACLAVAAVAVPTMSAWGVTTPSNPSQQATTNGVAVAYPWVFENGTDTARGTATESAERVLHRAHYSSIPSDVAKAAWLSHNLPEPTMDNLPSVESLSAFGKALNAKEVIYGSISWHTRSIWVNLGPKTISTATVDVYVFNVRTGKVVFQNVDVEGRSDEKSNGYKIAADILLTPLVTVVSGGPATPHEQRAVQLALGLAFRPWVQKVAPR